MSTNRIEEGASEKDIRDAGGHVAFNGDVYDKDNRQVWTTRGDLTMSDGSAQPRKDSDNR